jgi:hypothetical protein
MPTDQLASTGAERTTPSDNIDLVILDIFREGLGSAELGVVLVAFVEEWSDGVLSALVSE